jgi:predicted enzyme related to lactoylglutathione lyase
MLRGLTTVTFYADHLDEAAAWYTEALGVEPYFRKEFEGSVAYIEFRIGDYQHELGFLDRRFAPEGDAAATGVTGGAVVYWAVDDIDAAYDRLLALGATTHQAPREQGPGFVTASVIDPFGNLLGVMFNEHYLSVRAGLAGAGTGVEASAG